MPKTQDVERALTLIRTSAANHEYFFNRLDSPEWIQPLAQAGLFGEPPGIDRKGDSFRFPIWPESRFLARMANRAPTDVCKILLPITATDNERIHEDIVDAALSAPLEEAIPLIKAEIKWISETDFLWLSLPEKLVNLSIRLAKECQIDYAIKLMRALFSPKDAASEKQSGRGLSKRAIGKIEPFEYGEELTRLAIALSAVAPIKVIQVLQEFLMATISIEIAGFKETGRDHSYIWRAAVAQERQHYSQDLKNKVVTVLREALRVGVRERGAETQHIVRALAPDDAPTPSIIRRIVLDLISAFPARPNLSVSWPLSKEALEDVELLPEYAAFLKAIFPTLADGEKAALLNNLGQGPDVEAIQSAYKAFHEKKIEPEELSRRVARWKRDRLALLENYIQNDLSLKLKELITQVGEPSDLLRPQHDVHTGWGRTSSPVTEILETLSADKVPGYLREKCTEEGIHPDFLEDLGSVLANLAADAPMGYSATAKDYQGLEPIFVRSLISGLSQAVRKKHTVAWEPILALAEWVLYQKDPQPAQKQASALVDADWSWSRKAIADLLHEGLRETPTEIPRILDTHLWPVIARLAEDAEPDLDRERKLGDDLNPSELALNTIRGQAMHCLVMLAVRQGRTLRDERLERDVRDAAQALLNESLMLLDKHLEPENDPSAAIRSVYGLWFNSLYLLDPEWTAARTSRIFGGEERLRFSAWDAFLIFNQPASAVLGVLKDQYAQALESLSSERKRTTLLPEDPKCQLAVHMIWPYVRGCFDPTPFEGMLGTFFLKAGDQIRAYGIETFGRALKEADSTQVPADHMVRLKRLWAWRLEQAASDPKAHASELKAFGWWFVSGKFETEWSLSMLLSTLKLSRNTGPENMVLELLAEVSPTFPLHSVKCLREIILGGGQHATWGLLTWRDEARRILVASFASTIEEAKTIAREVVERLGAMGYREFRDLHR